MNGNLRQQSLAEVLRKLYADGRSGLLRVSGPKGEQRIHVKDGKPLYCDASDRPAQSREESESFLLPLFGRIEGEFSFEEILLPIDEELALQTPLARLIHEGTSRTDDLAVFETWLGTPETVLECVETALLPVFQLKLSDEEKSILELARERKRFAIADVHLEAERIELYRALSVLVALGLVAIAEKSEPESPSIPPLPDQALGERTGAVPDDALPGRGSSVEDLLETFDSKVRASRTPVSVPAVGKKEPLFQELGTEAVLARGAGSPWARRISLGLAGLALVAAVWLLIGPDPGQLLAELFGAQASAK